MKKEHMMLTGCSLIFFFFPHACMWVHVCTLCAWVWWTDGNPGCCSLGAVCLVSLRQGFSLRSRALKLGQISWPANFGIHLSPPHRPRMIRKWQPARLAFLIWVLGSRCRYSCLHNEHLTYRAITPAWHFSVSTLKPNPVQVKMNAI